MYFVIGLPPLLAGVKLIVARPSPATAVTFVGAPGDPTGATGVTLAEDTDAGESPVLFVATTLNV